MLLTCAGGSLVPWDLPKKWDVVYSNQGGDWNDFARNWTLAKACFQVLAKELGLKVCLGRLKLLSAISRAPPIPSNQTKPKGHPSMLSLACYKKQRAHWLFMLTSTNEMQPISCPPPALMGLCDAALCGRLGGQFG